MAKRLQNYEAELKTSAGLPKTWKFWINVQYKCHDIDP